MHRKSNKAGLLLLSLLVVTPSALSAQWYYAGPYSGEIRHLLTQAPGWRLTSCSDCANPDLKTPTVDVDAGSQRDLYVAASVMRAWAAESYGYLGETAKAERTAALMMETLRAADALCSGAPNLGGPQPLTLRIWNCPAPSVSGLAALPATAPGSGPRSREGAILDGAALDAGSNDQAGWLPGDTDSAMKVFRAAAQEAVRQNPNQLTEEENEAFVAGATLVGGVVDLFSGGKDEEDRSESSAQESAADLESANARMDAKAYGTAESLYSRVLQREQGHIEALVGRGYARLLQNNPWGALPDLRLAVVSGNDAAQDGLTQAFQAAGRTPGAATKFELLGREFAERAAVGHASTRGFLAAALVSAAGVGLGYLMGESTCSENPTLCETAADHQSTLNDSMRYFGIGGAVISFPAAAGWSPNEELAAVDRRSMTLLPQAQREAYNKSYLSTLRGRTGRSMLGGWIVGAILSGGLVYVLTE